ncbi:MAG: primosomal protein N', partial [Stellaceae bacterium]
MPDRLASSAAAVSVGCLGEEAAPADALPRLRVLLPLPLPLPAALDYRVPAEMTSPEPGSFVRVPLGGRNLVGVVWGGAGGDVAADRLRPIAEILPARRLAPDLRRFIERVAAYTMAPPGAVLRMAMSVPEALHPPRLRRLCVPADAGLAALGPATPHGPDSPPSLTPARRRVLEVLRDGPPLPMAEVARLAGCSPGVIRDLVASGLVGERRVAAEP